MSVQARPTQPVWWQLAICFTALVLVFLNPLATLARRSLADENVSHTLLIPIIVAWLLYTERQNIFRRIQSDRVLGLAIGAAGLASALYAYHADKQLHAPDALTFYILGFVLLCLAIFAFLFGRNVLHDGFFSFAFSFLLVPLPSLLLEPIISWLQRGSAEIAAGIFAISGVPVLREGLVFHLTRVSIEVAPECSGIRSSMALLVLALLVAHFSFRPLWKKVVFIAAGLLMMIIKNGVRIATLTLLANYVNPQFLFGRLHRQGGFVFFLLGLALLLPVFWWLKRGEASPVPAGGMTELKARSEAL
jgi:exosortase